MGLALLDHMTGYRAVAIVDSIQTGGQAPGFVHEVDAASLKQLSGRTPHFLGVSETLALGRRLELTMPKEVRIFAALITGVLRSYGITTDARTTDKDLADIEGNYWNSGGAFFVLLDGQEVIGTVALARETDSACELCRMYLAPAYRGLGLGRRLFDHALSEATARGFQEMHLKTASVLVEAISLYQRAGFTTVAGAEVGGNCDLVMTKVLPPAHQPEPPGP